MAPILIGYVIGPHGLRGQVKIKTASSNFNLYKSLQTADGRRFEIVKLVPAKDHLIVTFKSVANRDAAEAMKGTELFVDRAQLPPSTDDVYLADLVGRVVMHNSSTIGTIAGFQDFGAGPLMELDNGLLIPVRFATPGKTVGVDLPDGFLEDAKRDD